MRHAAMLDVGPAAPVDPAAGASASLAGRVLVGVPSLPCGAQSGARTGRALVGVPSQPPNVDGGVAVVSLPSALAPGCPSLVLWELSARLKAVYARGLGGATEDVTTREWPEACASAMVHVTLMWVPLRRVEDRVLVGERRTRPLTPGR